MTFFHHYLALTQTHTWRLINTRDHSYNVILTCPQRFALRCSFDKYFIPSLILYTLVSVQCLVLLCTQCLNRTSASQGSWSPCAIALTKAWLHGHIVDTLQFDLLLDFSIGLPANYKNKRRTQVLIINLASIVHPVKVNHGKKTHAYAPKSKILLAGHHMQTVHAVLLQPFSWGAPQLNNL